MKISQRNLMTDEEESKKILPDEQAKYFKWVSYLFKRIFMKNNTKRKNGRKKGKGLRIS